MAAIRETQEETGLVENEDFSVVEDFAELQVCTYCTYCMSYVRTNSVIVVVLGINAELFSSSLRMYCIYESKLRVSKAAKFYLINFLGSPTSWQLYIPENHHILAGQNGRKCKRSENLA